MRFARMIFCVVITAGCASKIGDPDDGEFNVDADGDDTGDAVVMSLSFELERSEIDAGEPLSYTVRLHSDGDDGVSVHHTVSSDLEDPLDAAGGSLLATVSGMHTLTANAGIDGESYEATATLQVNPGAAADLDLVLASDGVTAGDLMGFSVSGLDVFGNPLEVNDVGMSASEPDAVFGEADVLITRAGEHELTAESGSLSDSESFTVVAGPAAAISVELEETELEVGDDSDVLVTVTDAYGNEVVGSWTLGVDSMGAFEIDEDEVTFEDEGWYTVYAVLDGTSVRGEVDVLIDSSGPNLLVATPDRGSHTTDFSVDVTGTVHDDWSEVDSLTVNGDAVSWSTGGAFSHTVPFDFGIHIIETIATDDDGDPGNQTSDVRAVLRANEFWSPEGWLDEGIQVRLNEGDGGLGYIEALGSLLVDESAIMSYIPDPLYEGEYCMGPSWAEVCFDTELQIDGATIGGTELAIDCRADGLVDITFNVHLVHVDWSGDAVFGFSGDMEASRIEVVATIDPNVFMLTLLFPLEDVVATAHGFSFEVDGPIDTILGWFGFDVRVRVRTELESAIEEAVIAELPGMLSETLSELSLNIPFDVSPATFELKGYIDSILVDEGGLTLGMITQVSPDEVRAYWAEDGPEGSPYAAFDGPTFAGGAGAAMAFSTDFINQALYAFWAGGVMDRTMTAEDLGLELAVIAAFFPDLTGFTLVTRPMLPPVAVPVERSSGTDPHYEFQLGDMEVAIYNGDVEDEALYMSVFVSATAPMSIDASSGESLLISLGDPTVWVDVSYPAASSPLAAATEDLFLTILPIYLPEITGALGEIPIPSFEGMALEDVSAVMAGGDTPPGYFVLSGDLAEVAF